MSLTKAQWFGILTSVALIVVLMVLPTKQEAKDSSPAISALDAKIDSAVALVQGDNPMRGISMLREVLEEEPDNVEVLMHMGMFSMQSGQYEKAVQRFETVLLIEPDMEAAIFYAAQSQLELGQPGEAKKYFERFLEVSQDEELKDEVRELIQKF